METRLDLDKRELRLKYTYNSVCAMEERAGMPLDRFMTRQYSATRLLFWGALIELQPEITLAQAGEMIGNHVKGGGKTEDIANICAEALEKAGFFQHREK